MNDKQCAEPSENVNRGAGVFGGKAEPTRLPIIDVPDVRSIRKGYNLSQNSFATLLGISVGTLRNWEQGRRKPEGPARVLLQVAAKHPEAIWDMVSPAYERRKVSKRSSELTNAGAVSPDNKTGI